MAIVVAASLTVLTLVAALVLDYGLVRIDRQVNKSAADSAVLAGLHALNRDDGIPHSYPGVCQAVRYLKINDRRFSGINEAVGWTNGLGASSGNGCSSTTLRNKTCKSTDLSTWAKWSWSGTYQGDPISVLVESGFSFSGSTRAEDGLAASSGDTSYAGCDTLAVTITQSRQPGLGSVATSNALTTSIRSVGRVKYAPGDAAPAMLLLKRTGCPVLRAGNSGGGSGTYIHVLGAVTSNGISMPGTIHADTDGVGCTGGSNQNIFIGAQNSAIVAYAAPQVSNPTAADTTKPGMITTVGAIDGNGTTVIRDSLDYVYGSDALTTGGNKKEVTGRPLITRKNVDDRYFTGVKGALSAASTLWTGTTAPAGFNKTLAQCSPTAAQITALNLTATDNLFVDCTNNNGFNGNATGVTLNAGRVFFNGVVNPAGTIKMPNATKVYIKNVNDRPAALSIGSTGASFEMNNAAANMSGSLCSTAVSTTMSKATLFIRSGTLTQNGGTLRLCRTTMFLMGGRTDGCVPATSGTAPTTTPCGGALGNGQSTQAGGSNIDWTAPNTLDATLDFTTKTALATAVTAWSDTNGPEDLALWAESATSTSASFNMNGGGLLNVRGVFMVPNADPFKLGGGASMTLVNAQFIVSSIELNGGTQIQMKVDPNSAVILPDLDLVGLIR